MTPEERDRFVHELAVFLVQGQARKSMELSMGDANAKEWAALRESTRVFGYPTVEQAEAQLKEWLWG